MSLFILLNITNTMSSFFVPYIFISLKLAETFKFIYIDYKNCFLVQLP